MESLKKIIEDDYKQNFIKVYIILLTIPDEVDKILIALQSRFAKLTPSYQNFFVAPGFNKAILVRISFFRNALQDYKFMISLKLDHSHPHRLPCHPTRAYQQREQSILETDRQHISENDQFFNSDQGIKINSEDKYQFKTIQSRTKDIPQVDIIQLTPKKKLKKPITKFTPQQFYQANVIEQAFQGSKKGLPANIRELIMNKQKLIQDKVYLGISDKGSELLQRMYEQIDTKTHLKDRIQENLNKMMSEIQVNLEADILDGHKFIIHKKIRSKKEDVLKNRKRIDPNSLTFNSLQTSQTGNNQNSKEDSQSVVSSQPTHNDYSLKSQKTRKADQFIRKIQQQQQKQRKKRKQQEQLKKSFQVRSLEQKKQFQQQIKTQRRNYLKRRIEAKKQLKDKQIQIREKMNKQYKQFLKKYKSRTPLFKQKEAQFNKFQDQQRKREEIILQKRRLQKQSINIQQIKQHQKKYKQLKQQKKSEKQKQKRMMVEGKSQSELVRNYFKGKFHQILAEQQEKEAQRLEKQDPKFVRSQLIKKRDLYAKLVRENYFPKTDEAKQKQLRQLIESMQWTQKIKNGKLDIKQRNQAGNQYLKRLHELIADLRSKNKLPSVSKSINYQQLQQSTRPHYKNYLQQIKINRRRYSIDYDRYDKITQFDLESAQYRAQKQERNAQRREAYIMSGNFSLDRTLAQRKKIDDEYLQSVKAKMALLNKFD